MLPGFENRWRALSFCRRWTAFKNSGVAIIEFALTAPILVILLLNVVDFSFLIWARMQIDYSAQIGAWAAYKTCAAGTLPAKSNCGNLNSAVTTAVQSTSLGTGVTLVGGAPGETYYCVSGTTLTSVGTYSSPPSPFNCSAVGNPSVAPGDYITVNVAYTYTPTFSGLSLVPSQSMTDTALQRLK